MITFDRVGKRFPGVTALDSVSFSIARGECHALLGENGAGKSTLGRILAGLLRPDSGEIRLDGRPLLCHSPRDAARAGIGIVHQELAFCPNLSVAENLCLHDLPRRLGQLDRRETRRRANDLLQRVGLVLDPDTPMSKLSIAQEQLVQIAAAVGLDAKALVLDEPTSSLGGAEVARLFALIRELQASGTTIIYVSHRLEEIFEICQSVTVLRDGRHTTTAPVAEFSRDDLVRLMVGRPVQDTALQTVAPPLSPVRLRARGMNSPGRFQDVGFEIRGGEVVGLAGLVGAGRTELAEALFGLDPGARGELEIDGVPAQIDTPRTALALGVALVPEDRKRHGLAPLMTIRENLTLAVLDRFRRRLGYCDRRAESELAREYCRRLNVRAPGIETAVAGLSGGNQQKIVLAKMLATDCAVLVVDEPTRGVDVGAKQEIHELIAAEAARGRAVIVISSDLPELLAVSHRILVLRLGRLVREFTRAEATPETVLRWMAGFAPGAPESADAAGRAQELRHD